MQNCWGSFDRNSAALLVWAGVCVQQCKGWGLMCSTHPLPAWDMAGYVWLPQGTCESCLQLSGLLLCTACLQEQGKAWLGQLRGHQHFFWACVKKQQNDSFIARCAIVLYTLPLNYYVLSAAELSSQILRWL